MLSTSVMFNAYATKQLQAEPLPAPTSMPQALAQLT